MLLSTYRVVAEYIVISLKFGNIVYVVIEYFCLDTLWLRGQLG